MTLRACLRGLVMTATSLVCAAGAAAQPASRPFEQLWGAFGPDEPQVKSVLPATIKKDRVIVLYNFQAGMYPKMWQGQPYNGAVPLACDMNAHLAKLQSDINRFVPVNFDGYAVIDYEDWDCLWVHTPEEYREINRNIIRAQYANLTNEQVEQLAISEHERAAKDFFLQTINTAKSMRPNAKWGYYGYPRDHHTGANEAKMQWLWDAQTAFFPVAYTVYPMSPTRPAPWAYAPPEFYPDYMQNLVGLSRRQAGTRPVAAFVWARYHSMNPTFGDQFMNETDLRRMLTIPREKGADAVIYWEYVDGQQEVNDYAQYFSNLLTRVSSEVDRQFNPPEPDRGNPPPPPPGGGSQANNNGNTTPPPPPPPPPGSTSNPNSTGQANSGGSSSSGNTGTYTNTSIPGSPFPPGSNAGSTQAGTAAPDNGDGASSQNPNPDAVAQNPGDPAAASGNDQPAAKPTKKSKKQRQGVGTRTNQRFADAKGNKRRVLQRDLDRAAAQIRMAQRLSRNAASRPAPAQPSQSLADVPIPD